MTVKLDTRPGNLPLDLKPNLAEAQRHLELLEGKDGRFHFQTADDVEGPDGKKRHDRSLVSTPEGNLFSCRKKLEALNRKRAAVWVAVHMFAKEKPRQAEFRQCYRAVFADLENGKPDHFKLEPSLIVQTSPTGFHVWWFIHGLDRYAFMGDEDVFTPEEYEGTLRRINQDLAEYGADPKAMLPTQVLRLAGFYHCKREPFLVRIVGGNEKGYRVAELRAAFPALPVENSQNKPVEAKKHRPASLAKIESALAAIPIAERENRNVWVKIGMLLKRELGESGRSLWDEWSAKGNNPKYDEAGQQKWDSFNRSDDGKVVTLGTLFHMAEQNGWKWTTADAEEGLEPIEGPTPVAKAAEARKLVLDPRDPMRSARELIRTEYTAGDICTLRYHGGDFFHWCGTHFVRQEDQDVRAHAWRYLEKARREVKVAKADGTYRKMLVPFQPSITSVNNVVEAVKALANVSGEMAIPSWIEATPGEQPPAHEMLACTNGLLHVPTRRLLPSTPAFFGTNAVPFACDPRASEPQAWLAFLTSLWPDDPETVATLQEVIGLLLTPDTSFQKMFLIVGPKRSGKGTIARTIKALLGAENVCAPTLKGLGTNFGLESLISKQVAIVSDARLDGGKHIEISEALLRISGEDTLTIDRKHRLAWHGRLSLKVMVLSNLLPQLPDPSGALASRFILLHGKQSFYGREDLGLEARLSAELPGILNWALEGLDRLKARGRLLQPASGLKQLQQLEDLSSPINAFMRDCCDIGPSLTIGKDEAFELWKTWCDWQGRYATARNTFAKDLASVLPTLDETRPTVDGERERRYVGFARKAELPHGMFAAGTEFEPIPAPADLAAKLAAEAQAQPPARKLDFDFG